MANPGNSQATDGRPANSGGPTLRASTPAIESTQTSPFTATKRFGKSWWIGGILLLLVLLGLMGATMYFRQQHTSSSQNTQPKSTNLKSSATPTLSPTATQSASQNAAATATSKINLMPINAKTVTLTPQIQGTAYDSAKVAVDATTGQVRQDFAKGDAKALYGLFSSDLQAMVTEADLAAALQGVGNVNLQPVGNPIISTEWAKQTVSYTHNGATTTYDVILHKEDDQWKLYGTVQAK